MKLVELAEDVVVGCFGVFGRLDGGRLAEAGGGVEVVVAGEVGFDVLRIYRMLHLVTFLSRCRFKDVFEDSHEVRRNLITFLR